LSAPQLLAAFGGAAAAALWREVRGLDSAPRRTVAPPRMAVAEETLGQETNDGRVLEARLARLVVELGVGLRSRGAEARVLAISVSYTDGREGSARQTLATPTASEHALRAAASALLDRAVTRRVRIRRLRIEATEAPAMATQLSLWEDAGDDPAGQERGDALGRVSALEAALDRVRARFGTEALVPAAWMAHGLVLRPPARS